VLDPSGVIQDRDEATRAGTATRSAPTIEHGEEIPTGELKETMSKKHIATISPNKPVSEMTEAEIHKLAEEIANLVTPRLKASIEEQNKNS
jgi:hypothetical protein